MHPLAVRAVAAFVCALALLPRAQAQGPGPCRQGVLALIVMIDAGEHDRSHYRNTAKSVVESCGPPMAARSPAPAATASAFDRAVCGKLAMTMLESIESTKMGSPEFVEARDSFAAQCRGG